MMPAAPFLGGPRQSCKDSPRPLLASASPTANLSALQFSLHLCRPLCPSAELSSCVSTSFPLAYTESDFLGSDIPSPPLGTSHLCLSLLCSVPNPTWMFVRLFIRFSYPAYFSPIFFSVGVSALSGAGSLLPSSDSRRSEAFWLPPSSSPVFVAALVQSSLGARLSRRKMMLGFTIGRKRLRGPAPGLPSFEAMCLKNILAQSPLSPVSFFPTGLSPNLWEDLAPHPVLLRAQAALGLWPYLVQRGPLHQLEGGRVNFAVAEVDRFI